MKNSLLVAFFIFLLFCFLVYVENITRKKVLKIKSNVGKSIVVNGDTVTITGFSIRSNTYKLSNGNILDIRRFEN